MNGHSAIWLHIPIPLSRLISLASEQGFTLHHGTESEVLMTKWLQEGRTNRLPRYASHQVGVCGEYCVVGGKIQSLEGKGSAMVEPRDHYGLHTHEMGM